MKTGTRRAASFGKTILRRAYGAALGVGAVAAIPFSGRAGAPRVMYGGAMTGDVGGPLVKVKRLTAYFPEHRFDYNVVYALSNAPYMPDFALSLLKLRGIPIVHNQNGVFYPAWYEGDWKAENARMARTYHQADHVFWQSAFCRRAADLFLGPRAGAGEILFNAIDTKHFSPGAVPRAADGTTRFLVTGKFDPHLFYRIETTVRALARAVDSGLEANLNVAGWTHETVRLQTIALATSLGIADRIRISGSYTQTEAPQVYRAADIYVMTKHNDPCPNTVIEAMACGLPIVYSASGGVPELVGETGYGVPVPETWDEPQAPGVDALAEAMCKAAAERAALGAAARARAVERFDISHWIARHRAVFESLTQ
ncbi:MAG: glycosyltransferase family 4 protein [Telmatospirillum sp.]|nr:glycosyltransferase family 4 protein [Telmatospirillum sp.]